MKSVAYSISASPMAVFLEDRIALVLECDYRVPDERCSCQEKRVCLLGKGLNGIVGIPGCFACVTTWNDTKKIS